MRTTVTIDDSLLAIAKRRARHRGLTLGQLVERALRRELAAERPPDARGPEIPVFTGGRGVQPGVDLTSTRAVLEVLDEGSPIDRLR